MIRLLDLIQPRLLKILVCIKLQVLPFVAPLHGIRPFPQSLSVMKQNFIQIQLCNMKNSRTVQLHITAHDEDVTEQKKINYPTILNAIFYCQMENSSMERKCQEGCSHNSGPREHRVWFESYFLLSLPWQRIVAIDPRTKISFRL